MTTRFKSQTYDNKQSETDHGGAVVVSAVHFSGRTNEQDFDHDQYYDMEILNTVHIA